MNFSNCFTFSGVCSHFRGGFAGDQLIFCVLAASIVVLKHADWGQKVANETSLPISNCEIYHGLHINRTSTSLLCRLHVLRHSTLGLRQPHKALLVSSYAALGNVGKSNYKV